MRRVRMYWVLQQLSRPVIIEGIIMVGCFGLLQASISTSSIIHNIKSSSLSFFWMMHYFSNAVSNTEFSIKIILGIETAAGVGLIYSYLRTRVIPFVFARRSPYQN